MTVRRLAAAAVASAGALVLMLSPVRADPGLAGYTSVAGSESVDLGAGADAGVASPRDDAIVGATRVETTSEPRAEADGAFLGARGLPLPGAPGQCSARYPEEPRTDTCGLPAPSPLLTVEVRASGTEARSTAAAAAVTLGDLVRVGSLTSHSRSLVRDGVVEAATSSRAVDVTVAGILHIGSLEASAEAVHPGNAAEGRGTARTEVLDATVAGVAVTLGPGGLTVGGQPLGAAPAAIAQPVLAALAIRRMSIDPLAPPRVTRDAATGVVEASSTGVRVVLAGPAGATVEVILGRALARVVAVGEARSPSLVRPVRVPLPPLTGSPPVGLGSASVPAPAPAPASVPVPVPVLGPGPGHAQALPPRPFPGPEPPEAIGTPPAPSSSLPVELEILVVGFVVVLVAALSVT